MFWVIKTVSIYLFSMPVSLALWRIERSAFYNNIQAFSIISILSLPNCVPCVLKTCSRANFSYVFMSSRANVTCILTCSRAYVPCMLTCSRANVPCVFRCSRANLPCVLTWPHANVPCVSTCSSVNVQSSISLIHIQSKFVAYI